MKRSVSPSKGRSRSWRNADSSNRVGDWLNGSPQNYYVSVNVKYDFQLYTPLMRQLLGNPITMSVSVQMRTNY